MQKMVHIARSKQFLDTGGKFAPPPVQIRCKNSPVFIGLNNCQYPDVLKIAKVTLLHKSGSKSEP